MHSFVSYGEGVDASRYAHFLNVQTSSISMAYTCHDMPRALMIWLSRLQDFKDGPFFNSWDCLPRLDVLITLDIKYSSLIARWKYIWDRSSAQIYFPIISVLVPEIKIYIQPIPLLWKMSIFEVKIIDGGKLQDWFCNTGKMGTLLSAVIRRQLQTGFFWKGYGPKTHLMNPWSFGTNFFPLSHWRP